jgi:DNA-binding MarR family transcriptional regulator
VISGVVELAHELCALAELEGVPMPTMTDVVSRLERLGLLSRAPDPTDRRVLIEVTGETTAEEQ